MKEKALSSNVTRTTTLSLKLFDRALTRFLGQDSGLALATSSIIKRFPVIDRATRNSDASTRFAVRQEHAVPFVGGVQQRVWQAIILAQEPGLQSKHA